MWNPWKTHWALALVKGIREPHAYEVKKKFFWPRWESNPRAPDKLQGRTEKVGDDLGGESRRRESKVTYDSATRHNIHIHNSSQLRDQMRQPELPHPRSQGPIQCSLWTHSVWRTARLLNLYDTLALCCDIDGMG